MSTRREFIRTATMVAAANGISIAGSLAAEHGKNTGSGPEASTPGGPAVQRIRSARCRDETLRRLGGSGMFPCITWGADDQQLLTTVEGAGWPGLPKDLYVEGALIAVKGSPENIDFQTVPTYPYYPIRKCYRPNGAPVYSIGTALAVDTHIYVFNATFGGPWNIVDDYFAINENLGTKLIYSSDGGRTWNNQNGSTPVVWETAGAQSSDTMTFWKEPGNAFSGFGGVSFLQMGHQGIESRYSAQMDCE